MTRGSQAPFRLAWEPVGGQRRPHHLCGPTATTSELDVMRHRKIAYETESPGMTRCPLSRRVGLAPIACRARMRCSSAPRATGGR